jgi:hypothetical protein
MLCPSTGCGKFKMAAAAKPEIVTFQLPDKIAMPFKRQTPHPPFSGRSRNLIALFPTPFDIIGRLIILAKCADLS